MIKKVKARGRWRYRLHYRDVDGSQRSRTFDLLRDAREYDSEMLRRRRDAKESGVQRRAAPMSFGDFLKRIWLPQRCTTAYLSPGTVESAGCFFRKWVIGRRLGKVALAGLQPAEVNRFIASLERGGLAPSTIRQRFTWVRIALQHAVKLQLLQRIPFEPYQLEWPRRRPASRRAWSPGEVEAFLKSCKGAEDSSGLVGAHPLRAAFLTALLSGLRLREQMALKWSDLDLKRRAVAGSPVRSSGLISVARQIRWLKPAERSPGEDPWEFRELKAAASERTVDVSPELRRALLELRLRTRFGKSSDFVFAKPDGAPYGSANCPMMRTFRKMRGDALEGRVWHELRHSFGSMLLTGGASLDYVASQMGHASTATTANIYHHQLRHSRPEEIVLVDSFLKSLKSG